VVAIGRAAGRLGGTEEVGGGGAGAEVVGVAAGRGLGEGGRLNLSSSATWASRKLRSFRLLFHARTKG
jgi:hypothetical protein